MPAFQVERSIRIDADEAAVRSAVENYNEWPKWSPWLCMEPDAKVTVFGTPGQVGHGYDWDGQLVGAGGMKLANIENGRYSMDLHFLRPFKSQAKVWMHVRSVGENQTDVTWHMDGSLPFFLFFMVGMMKAMIGMDYVRGLKMLKDYVETGGVKSKTEVQGIVDVEPFHYLGNEAHCAMDDIGESMGKTLPAAFRTATENQLEMVGPPGALYHNVDLKQQHCHYTAFVQTQSSAQVAGVQTGTVEACKALKVVHTGSYEHLGNAWSTAMAYQRTKKLKPLKSQCSFERYPTDPGDTAEEDLITEIYIPLNV